MPIIRNPWEFNIEDLYVDLKPIVSRSLYLKCEGFNFAGSIKLKVAAEMVAAAEANASLTEGTILVESSSGNLGVALSMVAARRGHRFLCVTDPRCNHAARRMMEGFGATVHVITEPDPVSGYLGARLAYIRALCARDSRYVWTNQYANPSNWLAHYHQTAPAIAKQFPDLDVLFVGVGTTGTLTGCARYFRDSGRPVIIVAIDVIGSVTFGYPPGPRWIPGLGMGVRPPLLNESHVNDVVIVPEIETVTACRLLARHGFLFGGSTGTVVSGATRWLAEHDPGGGLTAVAIAPDLGERYLSSIYLDDWVREVYGEVGEDRMIADVPQGHLAVEPDGEPHGRQ